MLIYPGVAPLDVAGPLQVFGVSNFLAKKNSTTSSRSRRRQSRSRPPSGFAFLPSCAMTALAVAVDTLLVSGGGGPDSGPPLKSSTGSRQTAPKVRRFGSVCTGAFALGAAGLLEGKRVATHWAFGVELARRNARGKGRYRSDLHS